MRLSASIGVASFPVNGPDAAHLLQAADRAMYQVKEGGRNGAQLAAAAASEQRTRAPGAAGSA